MSVFLAQFALEMLMVRTVQPQPVGSLFPSVVHVAEPLLPGAHSISNFSGSVGVSLNAWLEMTRGSVSYFTVTAGVPASADWANAHWPMLSQLAVMVTQLSGMAVQAPFLQLYVSPGSALRVRHVEPVDPVEPVGGLGEGGGGDGGGEFVPPPPPPEPQ